MIEVEAMDKDVYDSLQKEYIYYREVCALMQANKELAKGNMSKYDYDREFKAFT